MTDIDFFQIRERADSKTPTLNLVRDRFFEELVAEHDKKYSILTPFLYKISIESNTLNLDLSPIGLNIKTEEKLIFINKTVIKQLSFLHHDELRQKIINIIDIYLHDNGTFSLSPAGIAVGELGNGYVYKTFFQSFFEQLKSKELITSDY